MVFQLSKLLFSGFLQFTKCFRGYRLNSFKEKLSHKLVDFVSSGKHVFLIENAFTRRNKLKTNMKVALITHVNFILNSSRFLWIHIHAERVDQLLGLVHPVDHGLVFFLKVVHLLIYERLRSL